MRELPDEVDGWRRSREHESRPEWPVYRCRACGCSVEIRHFEGRSLAEVLAEQRHCPIPLPVRLPQKTGALAKAAKYVRAVARWIRAGRPVRSRGEVARIYDELCRPCVPHFNAETGSCRRCGCRVNKSRNALLNKIKMGTEKCPVGKW